MGHKFKKATHYHHNCFPLQNQGKNCIILPKLPVFSKLWIFTHQVISPIFSRKKGFLNGKAKNFLHPCAQHFSNFQQDLRHRYLFLTLSEF